jgi:hypothetical protein
VFRSGDGREDRPYPIVPPAVKKLPPSYMRVALPLGLTLIMTFLVSGVATIRALGFAPGMFLKWMESWMFSWAIAFPTMLFLMPLVRRVLGRFIEDAAAPAPSPRR